MTTTTLPAGNKVPGFFSQLSAEWTKVSSARALYIQIGLAILLAIGMSALISLAIGSSWDDFSPQDQATFDPVFTGFFGLAFSGIVLTVTGVTMSSSEYTSGMIRLTLAVTPNRLRVLVAKAVVLVLITWVVALVITVGAFFVSQAVLGSYEGMPTVSLSDGDVQRAIVAAIITAPMFPFIGLCLGTILRSTAAAITATMGLMFVPSMFGGLLPRWWQENILAYLPGNASDTLLQSRTDYATYLEPGVAIAVILAWTVAFFVLAYVLMVKRDV